MQFTLKRLFYLYCVLLSKTLANGQLAFHSLSEQHRQYILHICKSVLIACINLSSPIFYFLSLLISCFLTKGSINASPKPGFCSILG